MDVDQGCQPLLSINTNTMHTSSIAKPWSHELALFYTTAKEGSDEDSTIAISFRLNPTKENLDQFSVLD